MGMLEDKLEKWYERTGRKLVPLVWIAVIVFVFIRFHVLGLIAPFIVAWIFAMLLSPFVTWAHKKVGVNRALGTIISMLTIMSAIIGLLTWIIRALWSQAVNFAKALPGYTLDFTKEFNAIEEKIGVVLNIIPAGKALTNLDTVIKQISEGVSSVITALIPSVYEAVSKLPDVFVFCIITLLSIFFMTKDYYFIKSFIKAQLSDTAIDRMVVMQEGFLQAVGGYLKTQCILMSITFSICLVGLSIFRLEYALLLAVIIAIVDALPVFGSGTILIPWSIYNMIVGNYTLGIGLLCIYGIIFVVRQILEPRILSSQIGVYALVTIIAVYVGYRLIGVFGLIVGPAVVVVLQMLQNVGALPQFKKVNKIDHRGERR